MIREKQAKEEPVAETQNTERNPLRTDREHDYYK
jgi:hypothetical protein